MFDNLWFYHSGAPKEVVAKNRRQARMRFLPQNFTDQPAQIFQIAILTQAYAPNHVVSLRTEVDGWGRDVHGAFVDDRWKFVLPKENYQPGFAFKFMLDHAHWMEGPNLIKAQLDDQEFNESVVRFSGFDPRFRHSYGNLRVSEDEAQQSVVHSSYDENINYEVIIIGSGMGGGVMADALSDRGVKTLVLDAGCLDLNTHVYNSQFGDPGMVVERHRVQHFDREPGTGIQSSVMMNLGGRSVFWSGVIPRMREWELAAWPPAIAGYLRGAGYPAAEKLMRKHITFGALEERLLVAANAEFTAQWEVVNTPRSQHQPEQAVSPALPPESFIENSTGIFSTAELLLDSLHASGRAGRDFLNVNLNHLVTRIDQQGSKVTAVHCQDLVGNRERTYHGQNIVLAAGSLESPKIALQSGLQDPDARIGVGLTDHPSYFFGYDDQQIFLPDDSPWAGLDRHARIFFYPRVAHLGHFFNVEIVINGRYWRVRHADDDLWQAEQHAETRTRINFKFIFASPLDDTNFVQLGAAGGKVRVRAPLNTVAQVARPAVEDFAAHLLRFFKITDAPPLNQIGYGGDGTVHHAGDTLRMGAAGPRVVDTDLKFLAYDNLYAADVSVFPFIPAANPSLTLTALALRLADHLAVKTGH